jgi:hypothetical protein
MSKTWKWILGTVVVLVVVAALGFLAWNAYGSVRWSGRVLTGERVRPPMMEGFERGDRGDWGSPRFPADRWHTPMMGGYGFMPLPFLFFGGLFRLVVPLGVLALVAYIAYRQGVKAGMRAALPAAATPAPVETPKRGRKVA